MSLIEMEVFSTNCFIAVLSGCWPWAVWSGDRGVLGTDLCRGDGAVSGIRPICQKYILLNIV